MDVIDVKQEEVKPEKLSLKDRERKAPKEVVIEKNELPESIRKFDEKLGKEKPKREWYDSVVQNNIKYTPTASEMITNPTYNTVGKFLGVDTLHEWNKQYMKVHNIVQWAQKKSGANSTEKLLNFLSGAVASVPAFGMYHRKLDQLHLAAKLDTKNKDE